MVVVCPYILGLAHLDGLSSENEEGLGSLCQEPGELVYQDVLDLIGLLDLDADAYTVDAGLDKDSLVLVARNRQGCKQHFRGSPGFDLGDIVSFGGLGSKVGETEGGRQTAPDSLEVGT